jgi:homocysteine S-methyltransferase
VAIEALAGFHLWRLRAVRSNDEAWDAVDYVAFETIPHLREVRAIKVAMARFFDDLLSSPPSSSTSSSSTGGSNKPLKGWWISLVFPNGAESTQWGPNERHHQTQSLLGPECPPTEAAEILTVLLDETLGAVPTGFGINCTRIDSYPSILSSIISNSKFASSEAGPDRRPVPLTLVVYPNGGRLGDTFDGLTHRWVNDGKRRADGRNITWDEEVVEVVQKCRGDWKDVIVGGCCRVYHPQIKTLREKVNGAL